MTDVRIVIASVLKPLYEPRMYEKIGISLSEVPNTNVHVIGYGSEIQKSTTNITAHGLGYFSRLSFARLLSPWKVLLLLFRIKPQILIACTHELLLPFAVYKVFKPKTKLVYDLQENYYLNILHTAAFPLLLRIPIALHVRLKERFLLPFYSLVLSAEKCYMQEMPFIQTKAICIENKALSTHNVSRSLLNNKIAILYSGTISKEYGIYDAIDLVEKMYHLDTQVSLVIRGYCAHNIEAEKLQAYIKDKPFIDANDFTKPLPYVEIVSAIEHATCGLLSYQSNKATLNRIPTKLYEYMSYRLPILSVQNTKWAKIIDENKAGITIDFKTTDAAKVLNVLKFNTYYNVGIDSNDFLWKNEGLNLKTAISKLLI